MKFNNIDIIYDENKAIKDKEEYEKSIKKSERKEKLLRTAMAAVVFVLIPVYVFLHYLFDFNTIVLCCFIVSEVIAFFTLQRLYENVHWDMKPFTVEWYEATKDVKIKDIIIKNSYVTLATENENHYISYVDVFSADIKENTEAMWPTINVDEAVVIKPYGYNADK